MNILKLFQRSKCETASQAKSRLQAIGRGSKTNIIDTIREDIMNILSSYHEVSSKNVKFTHDKKRSTLNLAIPLKSRA